MSMSAQETSELRGQIAMGALLAAMIALFAFGKPLAGVPTPFGISLGVAALLAIDAGFVVFIAWRCISPPRERRDVWITAAYALFLALMQGLRLTNPGLMRDHPRIVVDADIAAAVVLAIGGLFLLARAMRGAR